MLKRARAAALALMLGLIAAPARAVVLEFWATLDIRIASLPPASVPSAGIVSVNGSASGGHLTALTLGTGFFGTSGHVVPVTDPAADPLQGIQVTLSNAPGHFLGNGGAGFGGVMPLGGAAKVCLFAACSTAVANIVVPLTVAGAGGSSFGTAAVNVTVVGAPWTTGTVAIGTYTAMGGVAPQSNTARAAGNVALVTPVFVSTNIPDLSILPVFGRFSITFLPEPTTALLLGAGTAGLAAFARSRRAPA